MFMFHKKLPNKHGTKFRLIYYYLHFTNKRFGMEIYEKRSQEKIYWFIKKKERRTNFTCNRKAKNANPIEFELQMFKYKLELDLKLLFLQ